MFTLSQSARFQRDQVRHHVAISWDSVCGLWCMRGICLRFHRAQPDCICSAWSRRRAAGRAFKCSEACPLIKPPLSLPLLVPGMSDQAMDSLQTSICLKRVMWMAGGSRGSSHSWRYTYTMVDLAFWNVIESYSEQKDWLVCAGLALTSLALILWTLRMCVCSK